MAREISWLMIALALILSFVALSLALSKLISGCGNYSSSLVLERNEVSTRVGDGKLVKGYIENKGNEDELKLSVKGEGVVIRPEKVRLGSNEREDLFVYVSPYNRGNYTAKIVASSYCQRIESILRINVE